MIQLTLTLKMTTAQVVETSVTVNNNSPIQDYVHPDDQTQPIIIIIIIITIIIIIMNYYCNYDSQILLYGHAIIMVSLRCPWRKKSLTFSPRTSCQYRHFQTLTIQTLSMATSVSSLIGFDCIIIIIIII